MSKNLIIRLIKEYVRLIENATPMGDSWGKKSENVSESTDNHNLYYHGTNKDISKFVDDFVGGKDAYDQNGPGIYFTSSKKNASSYGLNVHTVELNPKKLISTKDGKSISNKEAAFLIKNAPDWKATVENWHENYMVGLKMAIRDIIQYNDNPQEQFLQIWIDFYKNNSVDYVRNMVKLGYDAVRVGPLSSMLADEDDIYHVIVLNPNIIKSIGLEKGTSESKITENSVFSSIGDINQTYINHINSEYNDIVDKVLNVGGNFILGNQIDKNKETYGNPNNCETNVFNFIKNMESDSKYSKYAGYSYHPVVGYLFEGESLTPIEHWWVYDSDRSKHMEVTPTQGQAKAYAGVVIKNGTEDILTNNNWFDVWFLKLQAMKKILGN